MKKKRHSGKIVAVFLILGAAFCVAGLCIGFRPAQWKDLVSTGAIRGIGPEGLSDTVGEVISDGVSEVQNVDRGYTGIKNLKIDARAMDCRLIPYQPDKQEEADLWKIGGVGLPASFRAEKEGDTLKLESTGVSWRFWNFGREQGTLSIYIPEDAVIQTMKIDTGAGVVTMKDGFLQCERLDLECGVGECSLNLDINKQANISCGVGEVNLLLRGAKEDFDYTLECGVGEIKLDGEKLSDLASEQKIDNHAEKKLELSCGVGDIKLGFAE